MTAKLETDFKKSQEIAALLSAAEEAFEANRMTSPSDDNALSRYKSVLAIEPRNVDADAGIQRIADRHVQLAMEEIAAYRFDQAESLLDQADTVYAGLPGIAPARQKLRAGRAAYDGRRPNATPPFRMTMLPVTGANTCGIDGLTSEVENFGTGYLRRDTDLNLVTTFTDLNDSWQDSGINKEPRADRLYVYYECGLGQRHLREVLREMHGAISRHRLRPKRPDTLRFGQAPNRLHAPRPVRHVQCRPGLPMGVLPHLPILRPISRLRFPVRVHCLLERLTRLERWCRRRRDRHALPGPRVAASTGTPAPRRERAESGDPHRLFPRQRL